jgi:hypothetical protein
MIRYTGILHEIVVDLITPGLIPLRFANAQELIQQRLTVRMRAAYMYFHLPVEMGIWALFLIGLHHTFCYEHRSVAPQETVDVIDYSVYFIMETFALDPTLYDRGLWSGAFAMCGDLLECINQGAYSTLLETIVRWKPFFTKNLRPVLWRIHVSMVPEIYRERGVFEKLIRVSDLSEIERDVS